MVDPKQNIEEPTFIERGKDMCMDGTEFLFTETEKK
jgi:hypothetical protein